MADAEFDETQRFGGQPPGGPGYGGPGFGGGGYPGGGGFPGGGFPAGGFPAQGAGPAGRPGFPATPGAGPLGDWLQDAGGWPGTPAAYPAAGPGMRDHSPWVTPPPLEPEEGRGRWSLNGAAPWVVAGLLCALLLSGRGAPPPVPASAEAPGAVAPADPAAAPAADPAAGQPGPEGCAAVAP